MQIPYKKMPQINPLSVTSLRTETWSEDAILSTATGFIIKKDDEYYFVTNKHVVSQPTAKKLKIYFHSEILGNWISEFIDLYENEIKKWKEHPSNPEYDVILLPLGNLGTNIKIYDLDLRLSDTDLIQEPSMPVQIIGYPAGISIGNGFPIWKTGHIASDPDLNYEGKPVFLIDATTKGGMSGSPVVLNMFGGFRNSNGNMIISSGITTKFLGIYSGRISNGEESMELGFVWKASTILDILNQ